MTRLPVTEPEVMKALRKLGADTPGPRWTRHWPNGGAEGGPAQAAGDAPDCPSHPAPAPRFSAAEHRSAASVFSAQMPPSIPSFSFQNSIFSFPFPTFLPAL